MVKQVLVVQIKRAVVPVSLPDVIFGFGNFLLLVCIELIIHLNEIMRKIEISVENRRY